LVQIKVCCFGKNGFTNLKLKNNTTEKLRKTSDKKITSLQKS
jgi:hypothetical protein